MKILVALHQVMDLGGIINHTEQLIAGLKERGHTVHLKQFVWSMNARSMKKEGDWIVGASGIPYDQGKGWNFDQYDRVAYQGGANLNMAKQILMEYDLIIWTIPVPSKNRDNLGNHEWPELYDLPSRIKQIAFVHDGNIRKGAPHIQMIQDKLVGLACVHACAMNGADFITTPRALILNPQENPVRDVAGWEDKRPGFVNMQTFKAWKHAHELVGAIRYMPPKEADELREIAGRGIEYQYLTSVDKCKDEYFHDDGERFWDAAIENGMEHHDYWNDQEVDGWLEEARVLVDPSWSKNYSKIGGHWNRVVVDAMIRGCVPVARRMGMGDELFKAGEHYVEIPQGVDPQQYAEIVLSTGQMDKISAKRFREANLELLPLFDRKTIADRVINLAFGIHDAPVGVTDPDLHEKAKNIMFEHFGVLM